MGRHHPVSAVDGLHRGKAVTCSMDADTRGVPVAKGGEEFLESRAEAPGPRRRRLRAQDRSRVWYGHSLLMSDACQTYRGRAYRCKGRAA